MNCNLARRAGFLEDSIPGLDTDHRAYLTTALGAAFKAGDYLLEMNRKDRAELKIGAKGHNDFVTEADRTAEAIIIETISAVFPDHSFLAEESGLSHKANCARWIIDPLDGTTNFIHGFPVWAVSIALEINGRLEAAAVRDPLHDETFYAVSGNGAFLNGQPIEISKNTDFSKALLLTGFPFKAQHNLDIYLESFKKLFRMCSGIRRAGCASLDLSWLAAGRADGFWELSLSPWDMAAGVLLIREAGGIVSDLHGDPERFMQTGNITAGNKFMHSEIVRITKEILSALP
jgi:myo-inositol-1(or 4)-monophosphatase